MRAVFLLLLQICCERRIHLVQTIERQHNSCAEHGDDDGGKDTAADLAA